MTYIYTQTKQPLSYQCPSCLKETCRIIVGSDPIILISEVCSNCKYAEQLPNPVLNKKIIALDHFCIDNIGKSRAGKNNLLQADVHAKEYEELDKQLQALVKRQLIVCPNTGFHDTETSYIPNSEHQKRTQKVMPSLAGGTRFKDPDTIFKLELAHRQDPNINKTMLPVEKVLYGELTEWYGPKYEFCLPKEPADGNFRKKYAQSLTLYLKSGYQSPGTILKKLIDEYKNDILLQNLSGTHMRDLLRNSNDDIFQELPMLRILAGMLSIISQSFAGTRKNDLNEGMASDLMMIAHTLPYVEAMLIDSEAFAYLQSSDKNFVPTEYKERVYSFKGCNGKNDINSFIALLKQIGSTDQELYYGSCKFKLEQVVKAHNANKSDNQLEQNIKSFMNKKTL